MATTKKFQANGLHCSSCSMLITMSVEDLDGVRTVECNHATGETVVTFDEDVIDTERIRSAIVQAGYDAEFVG
ncbi:MAG: heavy-metal-associated domain-containing protein [Coriobacteriia bacterium]|nr:heavy-metal-associated domain-containing protein [Coriobacteriia bacterium]